MKQIKKKQNIVILQGFQMNEDMLLKLMSKPHYGVDEVGRGCLNGDVVVASVMLGDDYPETLNDSKKLNEKTRDYLFDLINEVALDVTVIKIPPLVIDEINILQATMLGMKKSWEESQKLCSLVLVDGNRSPEINKADVHHIIKGDGKVPSISAASIVAKVTRDRDMLEMHGSNPVMGFDKHKGYGTKFHLAMMAEHGVDDSYRRSFAPVQKILSKQI